MAPGNTADEVRVLRERVVQLENELVLQRLNGRRSGEDRFRSDGLSAGDDTDDRRGWAVPVL